LLVSCTPESGGSARQRRGLDRSANAPSTGIGSLALVFGSITFVAEPARMQLDPTNPRKFLSQIRSELLQGRPPFPGLVRGEGFGLVANLKPQPQHPCASAHTTCGMKTEQRPNAGSHAALAHETPSLLRPLLESEALPCCQIHHYTITHREPDSPNRPAFSCEGGAGNAGPRSSLVRAAGVGTAASRRRSTTKCLPSPRAIQSFNAARRSGCSSCHLPNAPAQRRRVAPSAATDC